MKKKNLLLLSLTIALLSSCGPRIGSDKSEVTSAQSSVSESTSKDYQKGSEIDSKTTISSIDSKSNSPSSEISKASSVTSVDNSTTSITSQNQNTSVETSNTSTNTSQEEVASCIASGSTSEGYWITFIDANVNNAKAYYKLSNSKDYIEIDSNLIRNSKDSARVDYIGLAPGTYDFKILTSEGKTISLSNQKVYPFDRSGYAHFNASKPVGAYNNNGTLKNNAKVIYVNDNNKNTVEVNVGTKTYKGIVSILQNSKSIGVPLDIRIIGRINAASWNLLDYNLEDITPAQVKGVNNIALEQKNYTEQELISGGFNSLSDDVNNGITVLDNLTNKIKYDNSKNEFDSYYNMADITNASEVTIEGIGDDATLYQWGFTFKNSNHIEVRNLTFDSYPEDACSFEGNTATAEKGVTTSYDASALTEGRNWIHNNVFKRGINKWDVCNEQDKHDGDGSTDIKYTKDVTFSYNHYINTHKTGLVGGGDAHLTANVTFHHNYYQNCQARLPYARQANMHMYNNYYSGSTGNNMQIYAGAYAFIENSYFENVKTTFLLDSKGYTAPAIKSFNNIYKSCGATAGATIVSSRDAKVTNGNIFNQNFDTDSSYFYYDEVNKVSKVSYLSTPEKAKEDCVKYSGINKPNMSKEFISGNIDTPIIPVVPETTKITMNAANYMEENPTDYTSSFGDDNFQVVVASGTTISVAKGNYFEKFDKGYTAEIKLGGSASKTNRNIAFTLPKNGDITIYARSANPSTARSLAIYKNDGTIFHQFDTIIEASELKYSLPAGSYYIGSTNSAMNIGAIILEY